MLHRERAYAKTIRHADFAGTRIERILVLDELLEAIRFAAVKSAEWVYLRPLDIPEDELLVLIGDAIAAGVSSAGFLNELRGVLDAQEADRAAIRGAIAFRA